MSGGVYGGDEVGALVFDPGHQSLRVGYAGEDCPKSEIPSFIGISYEDDEKETVEEAASKEGEPMEVDSKKSGAKKKKFHIDTSSLNFAKQGMEVATYLRDGMVEDWDMLERLLDYSYSRVLRCESSKDHPVLFSEASWNQVSSSEIKQISF